MECSATDIGERCEKKPTGYINDKVLESISYLLNKSGLVKIYKPSDVVDFKRSVAFYELLAYINKTSEAIQKMTEHDLPEISPTLQGISKIFDRLNSLVRLYPPNEQDSYTLRDGRQHIGNCAFCGWHKNMQIDIYPMINALIPVEKCDHVNELGTYLGDSFGSPRGSIYGTGHELSFLFFMCALFRLGVLETDELAAAALYLFSRYLLFVRHLQAVYDMVPAGTQNAYSIDDFQFMPYLWGVAQLCVDPPFAPADMIVPNYIDQFAEDYMLMGAIKHATKLKEGDFASHSPLLWSACTVRSWSKLYKNLLNMYLAEVVSSFALLQKTKFGRLMPFTAVDPGTEHSKPLLGQLAPLYVVPTVESDEEEKKKHPCPLLAKDEEIAKQTEAAALNSVTFGKELLFSVAEMLVYRPSASALKPKRQVPIAHSVEDLKAVEKLRKIFEFGSLCELESSSGKTAAQKKAGSNIINE